ncbi:hypothetical protein [Mucilaginibacter ginsenosidivorax]|uniref:Uncharacterized protein n=1 Tax=Mucilaginibacter ginsenosidivorax TaxID=862126 RepID=A0A5B8W418_9SPHI|nr:hypothetical protein [Mucilaginibacter ginsenosidivorax]QEC78279.1 hypothetical protein FSB76_20900 [Mucilaginibacter ginsenosidivorax]
MKNIICAALFLFIIPGAQAQAPAFIIKRYKEIFRLIKADKAQELSKLVAYPLKRQNPLKSIANANEFVAYFPVLFDDAFKKKIVLFADSDVFDHHGEYGLVGGSFDGDIWLNSDGRIQAVNYSSRRETDLKNQLTKEIQSKIYPTVSHWDENVLLLQSPKLLIRIDRVGQKLRYVSWSQGRPTSTKPDLVLNNGVEEAQGTQGGWTYTFKNGDWTYVIDDVEMCETASQCGYFLRLSLKDVEKSSTRLKLVK